MRLEIIIALAILAIVIFFVLTRNERPQVGTCTCPVACYASTYDFNINPNSVATHLSPTYNYRLTTTGSITMYGFSNAGTPVALASRGTNAYGENGFGIWNDLAGIHEIDTANFIQIDVSALKSYYGNACGNPTISVGSIQLGEGYEIRGSNVLGTIGTQLYTFTGTVNADWVDTVSLFNPSNVGSPVLYNYISIRAIATDVTLVNIRVPFSA